MTKVELNDMLENNAFPFKDLYSDLSSIILTLAASKKVMFFMPLDQR